MQYTKPEGFIFLNRFHSAELNIFFSYYTYLGDGLFSIIICVVLFLLKQRKLSLFILVAYLSSGLMSQVVKGLVFSPRPVIYFETNHLLYYLDNFKNSGIGNNSFPSGHTTSAFAMATVLAVFCPNKYPGILFLLAAIGVGYARIYLAEHFPADVLAGALLGVVFGTLTLILLNRVKKIALLK